MVGLGYQPRERETIMTRTELDALLSEYAETVWRAERSSDFSSEDSADWDARGATIRAQILDIIPG